VYADVDGTLAGPGGSLFATRDGPTSQGALAVAALHRAGVELVLVSGRTRDQTREAARLVGAGAFIAELGAFVVRRTAPEAVTRNFGAYRGPGSPFGAMARSGAGAFLLERYEGRLEPHTPWAFQDREATMLFRGLIDEREATEALARARYGWLEVRDNGPLSRSFEGLDLPEAHAYHLVPRGVNKASAVRIHREEMAIGPEQAAAVGDSASDVEMATEVGAMVLVGGAAVGPDPPAGDAYVASATAVEGFAQAVEALLGREL
jgi:hydroxymethylpyrimidine pyrophosphatase-like HAD family hydrolase